MGDAGSGGRRLPQRESACFGEMNDVGQPRAATNALALVGFFELLSLLIRSHQRSDTDGPANANPDNPQPRTTS
jgi:hypothetical protein